MIWEAVGINDGSECRPLFQHWDVMQEKKTQQNNNIAFTTNLNLLTRTSNNICSHNGTAII